MSFRVSLKIDTLMDELNKALFNFFSFFFLKNIIIEALKEDNYFLLILAAIIERPLQEPEWRRTHDEEAMVVRYSIKKT